MVVVYRDKTKVVLILRYLHLTALLCLICVLSIHPVYIRSQL